MTFVLLAFEYMIWSAFLESIKEHSQKIENEQNNKLMYNWKPLTDNELENIKKLTN